MNNIVFKEYSCTDIQGNRIKFENKTIPLYIVMTRQCNVNCRFCEYHCGKSEIDIERFRCAFNYLVSKYEISHIHFTGGEPTLEIDKLKKILDIIKSKDRLIETSVNTNGTKLKELENIENLDNIALSRHAISDIENQEIFRSKLVPTVDEIKEFKDKQKIHLSCNLIKGHIDNSDKIVEYLEFASELGINDVGVVSLMNINDYCKDAYIDFSKIDFSKYNRLKIINQHKNINNKNEITCMCENYLYRAKNLNLVSMYHRYAIKNNEIADYLVYENNELKQGFNGKIIKLN